MMKKILFTALTTTLLLASAAQIDSQTSVAATAETTKVAKKSATETGPQFEIKKSKREEALEAKLSARAAEREKKAEQRETMLKKLDADLASRAEQRAAKAQ